MTVKTQGEIEAAICEGISRFEQEFMGRGPKESHTHLIGDLLVVRLRGALTAPEKQLANADFASVVVSCCPNSTPLKMPTSTAR